jgi:xanthine/CO dehydrogenase XdhC/CoxF family maturation factor
MNVAGLLSFFEDRRESGTPMVLVTVYDTQGSTYSKAGAQMLIDADGKFHGMLSGGCLEGDLALRAEKVIETGETMSVAYDLSVDDDLWGLGVGCDGTMFVLLQRLSSDNEYQPFGAIADAMALDRPVRLAVVVESVTAAVAPGATIVSTEEQSRAFGADEGPAAELSTWLHGPAGLAIGGRGPAVIALSIVAEIQSAVRSSIIATPMLQVAISRVRKRSFASRRRTLHRSSICPVSMLQSS